MESASYIYRFGLFRLDPDRRLLERAGARVELSPRGFDILHVLVENRDRVLSRAEIMSAVWPAQTVEEHNLSVQMSKLRQALGEGREDGREDGRVIATVPGRGYRFVAPLEPEPLAAPVGAEAPAPGEVPAAPPRPRRGLRLAVALAGVAALSAASILAWQRLHDGAAPTAAGLSIVVMPLRDLSDRTGQGYLADAISDDLTTDLSHLPGSVVIARETADSYKGKAVPVAEIGRRLGVRYLLEGSMRAEGGVLHVNAQLIDTATSSHLWAERFDAPQTNPDQAREAIVRRLANVLDLELVSAESARGERERPDAPDALDLFFRARSILDHGDTLQDFQMAQGLLERAVAMQPGFAEAQAALGSMLLRKVRTVDDPAEQADFTEAKAMIAKALAAAPRNAAALAARAYALLIAGQAADARYAAQSALAQEPDNLAALGVLASCDSDQGRLDEAATTLETLLRLNPESASSRSRLLQLGNIRLLQGRFDPAIDLLHRAVAGDPEPTPGVDSWGRAEGVRLLLTAAYALKGDTDSARALYAQYERLWPHRTVWRIWAAAPRAMGVLPGFSRMLDGLKAAGMPAFADEHADLRVRPPAQPVLADSFAATPLAAPAGAQIIDTAALKTLLQRSPAPLVLDLGRGAAAPLGAVWQDPAAQPQDDALFVDAALARAGRKPADAVVVMGEGTFGYAAYDAALRLVAKGFEHVYWYRGGEEAWSEAKAPASDRRS